MTAAIYRFFTDKIWRENRASAYASVGTLVFLTSFFWSPSRDFMHVVFVLSFFGPVALVLLLRRPDWWQYGGWFTGLALLYAAYSTLSTLWSPEPRLDTFTQHFVFLAVWLAGTSWLASRSQLPSKNLAPALVYTGAIASVVYQLLFHWYSCPLAYSTEWGTRLGLFGWGVPRNPNTIGFFFGTTTIFAYLAWLSASGWRENLRSLILLLLNIAPVVAAQSRGVILTLAFVLPLAFWLHRRPLRKWRAHVFLLTAAVGATVASGYHDDMVSLASSRVAERSDRAAIWEHVARESLEKHLWFGTGLVKHSRIHVPSIEEHLPSVHHAHNSYLDALYRTGVIGLVLMLAHMLYVLCHWSCSKELLPLFLWFSFGCLVSVVANPAFFWYLDAIWWDYWIPAGLIGALVSAGKRHSAGTATNR